MPNHVHFVVVPQHEQSLALLFKDAHRNYTRMINFRMNWRGHLWQERFHSFVMDDAHLAEAVRYVELNPVAAGLCATPLSWRWSSVHAHSIAIDDDLITVKPMLDRFPDWAGYLAQGLSGEAIQEIHSHLGTGRPLGDARFIERLETITGRVLKLRKVGRKPGH